MEKKLNKIIISIPLIITLIIFSFLLFFILQNKDPSSPPSALLKKELPEFETINLLNNNIKFDQNIVTGKKVLINFFASWCAPCKVEHDILMQISKRHKEVLILGFNHKDKKTEAINFIGNLGNPYDKIGIDDTGKIAMNFGVYGLPETFLLNEEGIIIFKHVGPLTKKLYNEKIKDFLSN